MKSRLNLKPGQKGTKQLVEKYGKSLLYVRYRYEECWGIRLKTVKIVLEEKEAGEKWDPEAKLRFVPYGLIHGTELEERIPVDFNKRKRMT